jgi:hypothetical protein
MKQDDGLDITTDRLGDSDKEWLEWVPIDELSKHIVYPLLFQTELSCLPETPKHIVTVE